MQQCLYRTCSIQRVSNISILCIRGDTRSLQYSFFSLTSVASDELHKISNDSQSDVAIGPFVIDGALISSNLIAIRKRHDSEVVKHKGNERSLIHPDELTLELSSKTKGGNVKASDCSKIIAVCFKSLEEIPTGEARRHRWNINVKINFSGIVKDTAAFGQVHLQGLLQGGEIKPTNPIKPGSFLIVIKHHVRSFLNSMQYFQS